jgi:protein-L-isoaspartate(D-aspartate) O-methyltransferase
MNTDTLKSARIELARRIDVELGPFDRAHLDAIAVIDRARFVRPGDEPRSIEDAPLPLDDEGHATVSAPHAYLLSFRLLGLRRGDRLVELGTGTGYGAALAAHIVGDEGHVLTIEIEKGLAGAARMLLEETRNVEVCEADAVTCASLFSGAKRVVCTFAIDVIPDTWIAALGPGGVLVAPVGPPQRDQRLLRVERTDRGARVTDHGGVRYVRNRGAAV